MNYENYNVEYVNIQYKYKQKKHFFIEMGEEKINLCSISKVREISFLKE